MRPELHCQRRYEHSKGHAGGRAEGGQLAGKLQGVHAGALAVAGGGGMNPQVLSGSDLTAIDIRRARGRAYWDNLEAEIPFGKFTNLLCIGSSLL